MRIGVHFTIFHKTYQFTIIFTILLIAAFGLVGCSSTPPTKMITSITVEPLPSPTPYPFHTAVPGTASIRGQLVVTDPTSLVPGGEDSIFLVPLSSDSVSGIPQFKKGEVPQADVNEYDGVFQFNGIKPGKYVVVVETMSGSQIPATTYKDRKIAVVIVDNSFLDKTTDIGLLSFP